MACGLGFTAGQCAEDHWIRSLEGGKEASHYRFRCPVCGGKRNLEVTVKGGTLAYRCWRDPACTTAEIRAELADLLPCWQGRKPRRRTPDLDALTAILLNKSLPPNALRLAALRELGMTEAQIKAKLRFPRQTYYDAVRILAAHRR